MLAVSNCLLGVNCKYNGGNNYSEKLVSFLKGKDYIVLCPEVMGGLKVPRVPCEIVGERVLSKEGEDFTKEYKKGAEISLALCKEHNVDTAILQTRSPSCGCGLIYDGTFTNTKIKGDGITARLLKENGINVINIEEFTGEEYYYSYLTEIGTVVISATETGISGLTFSVEEKDRNNNIERETDLIKEAHNQLQQYFSGKRKEFHLPLEPKGTEFQRKDWKALCTIPYGETRSYKQIAAQIGSEKACRAVGMANNKNPISIIVPCHRVIGSNGDLVGYGGGLEIKKRLLELEQKFKDK